MKLADIDKQIADLEAKKRALLADAKKTAKKKVEMAIQELNALGFSYKLVASGGESFGGIRRTGIRDSVLAAVKKANGIRPSDIAATLGMDDKAGKQSISNALSALKKAGAVVVENGKYKGA